MYTSKTKGGKCVHFNWYLENKVVEIEGEEGQRHEYQIGEIQGILNMLAKEFGEIKFPLANDVVKLRHILNALEQKFGKTIPLESDVVKLAHDAKYMGLGVAILLKKYLSGDGSSRNRKIHHAQGASYLGVVLEEAGYFFWNERKNGIEWKLIDNDFTEETLTSRLSRHSSAKRGRDRKSETGKTVDRPTIQRSPTSSERLGDKRQAPMQSVDAPTIVTIPLTKAQIDAAIPRVAEGLRKYLWLQQHRDASDLRFNADYQRRFNHFYKVHGGKNWQKHFYGLLEGNKGKPVQFGEILTALYRATNRYEASFASKLVATIDPNMPVIDSIVLGNLGLKLPPYKSSDRALRIQQLHAKLLSSFKFFLESENGKDLVSAFREAYPDADISEIKMLDLVLWQTRPKREQHPRH